MLAYDVVDLRSVTKETCGTCALIANLSSGQMCKLWSECVTVVQALRHTDQYTRDRSTLHAEHVRTQVATVSTHHLSQQALGGVKAAYLGNRMGSRIQKGGPGRARVRIPAWGRMDMRRGKVLVRCWTRSINTCLHRMYGNSCSRSLRHTILQTCRSCTKPHSWNRFVDLRSHLQEAQCLLRGALALQDQKSSSSPSWL